MPQAADRPWLKLYPEGVAHSVDYSRYASLLELFEEGFGQHGKALAYRFMGKQYSFDQIDAASRALAAWLQAQGLQRGDRVAVMLPNVPQYPVAVAAVVRAGYVVVNVNPLYTPRELEHQLKDSGAKAIIILENFAHVLQKVSSSVPTKTVLVTSMGEMLGFPKGMIVNYVVRKVKKLVPEWQLPGHTRMADAIAKGKSMSYTRPTLKPDDIAVIQYTGGTTGVSKGAVLLHRNLVANLLQSEAWFVPVTKKLQGQQTVLVSALPLYHIFGFTVNMLFGFRTGAANILIPNPRDIPAMFKELKGQRFHSFPAVNTLFNAMVNHPQAGEVDWSNLIICMGGGMAVTSQTAKLWKERTGLTIVEGYGLSETSPVVSANPVTATEYSGNIGLPFPDTIVKIVDDDGNELPQGQAGEIAVKGPQVMAGYWQRPDETAKVMTADGFFRTGDIGEMSADGVFRIVDRKKDMVLVSGFNVYPNEVEEVISRMPGVLEVGVIGVPDERAGELVKAVVVKRDPALTEAEVRSWCEKELTGYKRPKFIEFRDELPKTPVGKILRRELRGGATPPAAPR